MRELNLMEGLELLCRYGFRQFDSGDWDGLAGATPFSNHIEPFILETSKPHKMMVVIDKHGMEVHYNEKTEDSLRWRGVTVYHEDAVFGVQGNLNYCLRFLEATSLLERENKESLQFILDHFMERYSY